MPVLLSMLCSRASSLAIIPLAQLAKSQYVEINGFKSRTQPIETGVPQGSILGRVLFLFYINDIINIDEDCKFIIYADDCTLFFTGKKLRTLEALAANTCYKLRDWCTKNNLTLNETKTKCVLFRALAHPYSYLTKLP